MIQEGTYISNKYRDEFDKFSKIVEKEYEVKKIKKQKEDYLKYIHCNGCIRKCSLSNANCGRGKNLIDKF